MRGKHKFSTFKYFYLIKISKNKRNKNAEWDEFVFCVFFDIVDEINGVSEYFVSRKVKEDNIVWSWIILPHSFSTIFPEESSDFLTGKSKYLLLSDFVIWKFSLSSKQSLRSILANVEVFDVSFNFIVYDFVPGNDGYYVSQESKYFAPPRE